MHRIFYYLPLSFPILSPYALLFFLSLYCRPAAWLEGGMNAPPPHHNQYQYHQQYPGGPQMGGHGQFGGGSWSHQQQPLARFAAERARATGGGAATAQAPSKDDKTSPFVSSLHSHPAFQPQKIGKGPGGVSCYSFSNYIVTRVGSRMVKKNYFLL